MKSASEGNGNRPTVGSTVWIRYKGGVLGESPLDDRSTGNPLRIVLGTSQLPRGIEQAIMTLGRGAQGTFQILPSQGFGEYQEKFTEWYPRLLLDHGSDLKEGSFLFWRNPEDGSEMPAWIREEKRDVVLVDFNHPFAGKTLEYWIELVDFA